jgi:hypothetical protein
MLQTSIVDAVIVGLFPQNQRAQGFLLFFFFNFLTYASHIGPNKTPQ